MEKGGKEVNMYHAEIVYTEELCIRLSKVQYTLHEKAAKIIRVILGAIPFIAALAVGIDTLWGLLLILLSIYFFFSTDGFFERNGKRTYRAIGIRFRKFRYRFNDDVFIVNSGGVDKECAYDDIKELVTDGEYVYLFMNEKQAYMADLSTVTSDGRELSDVDESFRDFLQDKTKKKWKWVSGKMPFMYALKKKLHEIHNI